MKVTLMDETAAGKRLSVLVLRCFVGIPESWRDGSFGTGRKCNDNDGGLRFHCRFGKIIPAVNLRAGHVVANCGRGGD